MIFVDRRVIPRVWIRCSASALHRHRRRLPVCRHRPQRDDKRQRRNPRRSHRSRRPQPAQLDSAVVPVARQHGVAASHDPAAAAIRATPMPPTPSSFSFFHRPTIRSSPRRSPAIRSSWAPTHPAEIPPLTSAKRPCQRRHLKHWDRLISAMTDVMNTAKFRQKLFCNRSRNFFVVEAIVEY